MSDETRSNQAPAPRRRRFPGISPEAYRHPFDLQATKALRAVPGFDLAASKFSRYSIERFLYVMACADAVRVTPRQCGRIHAILREACDILDVRPEPAFFLSQTPIANAYALGREMPSIVIHTGLVELLSEEELMAVIAHEVGHIHCGHSVYRLMLLIVSELLKYSRGRIPLPGLGDYISLSMEAALLEWSRMAEFSADRAAILCVQDPEIVFSALFKLTGGSPRIYEQMDREEYLRQAEEYDDPKAPPLDRFYKVLLSAPATHPIPVLRAREALRYGETADYRDILGGRYLQRDKVPGSPDRVMCPVCSHYTDRAFTFCTHCGASFVSDESDEALAEIDSIDINGETKDDE